MNVNFDFRLDNFSYTATLEETIGYQMMPLKKSFSLFW